MTTSRATTDARPGRRIRARRSGVSLLEVQVAFVVFGIALAGLGPLVVMYQRLTTRMESHMRHQPAAPNPPVVYFLVPSTDAWARKLGVSATAIVSPPGDDPGPPADPAPNPTPTNDVGILSAEPADGDRVTLHVSVTAHKP